MKANMLPKESPIWMINIIWWPHCILSLLCCNIDRLSSMQYSSFPSCILFAHNLLCWQCFRKSNNTFKAKGKKVYLSAWISFAYCFFQSEGDKPSSLKPFKAEYVNVVLHMSNKRDMNFARVSTTNMDFFFRTLLLSIQPM